MKNVIKIALTTPFDASTAIDLFEVERRGLVCIGGKPVSLGTIRKYAKTGFHPYGKEGPCVILPTVRVRCRVLTMEAWIRCFVAAAERHLAEVA